MKFWRNWTYKTRLLSIFALAMVVRLLFILPKGNDLALPYRDQNTYYTLGRAIVDDGFLGPPKDQTVGPYYAWREKNPPPLGRISDIQLKMKERWDGEQRYYGIVKWGAPSSFFEPLYPLFSALSYWVVGDRFIYPRLFLALMSSFTCLLVFGIGKRLFNENVGYISALICAFYPYFIFYCVFLMSETFVIFFLALSVYFYARIREKNERLNSVLLGMSLGLTFLSRSIVLGLIPVMLFFLLIENWRKYLYPAFIALVFFCLTISPWIIRNYNLWGEFVLLSTRGGYNLWFRNNPYYYEDELTALGEKVPKNILDGIQYREFLDYPQFSPEQNEIVRNRILTQEGIKFIKANPQLIKYLCWFRFKSLLGVQGVLAQGLIYKVAGFLTFGILFPLGVLAFLLDFKKWRVTFPLMAIFAYFIAVYTLTHDGIRYRLPADPYIIILASVIITGIVEWAYRKLIIDK